MSEYLLITNKKTGNQYKISNLKSYQVESSLVIPIDGFDFTMGNINGEISDVISAGDDVDFYINNQLALKGIIDDFFTSYNLSGSDVSINGRDKLAILMDNDALPKTVYNLSLQQYLEKYAKPYGITKFSVSDNSKIKKIVIGPGESEWSVIEKNAKDKGLYNRYEGDTLKLNYLRSDTNYNYHFSNDYNNAIKIKEASIKLSADVKNNVFVYSDTYDDKDSKTKNIKGNASDINLKIQKRMVTTESELTSTSAANKKAKELLNEKNRDAFEIVLTTYTKQPIFVGNISRITIKKLELDCYLIVDSVEYTKDISSGSLTTISLKLIEGVKVNWKNHNIPILPKLR